MNVNDSDQIRPPDNGSFGGCGVCGQPIVVGDYVIRCKEHGQEKLCFRCFVTSLDNGLCDLGTEVSREVFFTKCLKEEAWRMAIMMVSA